MAEYHKRKVIGSFILIYKSQTGGGSTTVVNIKTIFLQAGVRF
jgi:hypothetical protein